MESNLCIASAEPVILSMPEGPNLSGIQHGSVLLVPSQYEPVCQGDQTSPEFNMSPRGPQLTLGRNAKKIVNIISSPPNAMYCIVYLIWQPIISAQIRSLIFFVFMVTYPNGTYRIPTIIIDIC